jgi:hypothetical protein
MNVKDAGSRLFRWRIHLEEYDYESVYRKGSLNTHADALSWINTIHVQRETKTVVSDEETKKQMLYEYRGAHIGRHQGINKTDTAIKGKYSWHSMKQGIEEYINECKSCQLTRC